MLNLSFFSPFTTFYSLGVPADLLPLCPAEQGKARLGDLDAPRTASSWTRWRRGRELRARHSPLIPTRFNPSLHTTPPLRGQAETWKEHLDLPPPRLKTPSPAHTDRASPDSRLLPSPLALECPQFLAPGPWAPDGTRRWFPFVLPSRYPLSAMLSSLPYLPWGLAEGRAGPSHPLGTVPRLQDSRGSWPWGAVYGGEDGGRGRGRGTGPEMKVRHKEAAGCPGLDTKHSFIGGP